MKQKNQPAERLKKGNLSHYAERFFQPSIIIFVCFTRFLVFTVLLSLFICFLKNVFFGLKRFTSGRGAKDQSDIV